MAQHSSTKILIFVSLILQGHTAQGKNMPIIISIVNSIFLYGIFIFIQLS